MFHFILGKKFHCKRVSGTLAAVRIQKPGSQIRRAGRVGRPEDHEIKTDNGHQCICRKLMMVINESGGNCQNSGVPCVVYLVLRELAKVGISQFCCR